MKRTWQETLYDAYGQSYEVDKVFFEMKTDHQHLMIFQNARMGRVMVLDGVVQTTEKDEFIYHEMLTHVPIFAHGNAKRVLIVGGGDGGMLRETCRHKTIEHITQVEIDRAVVDMAIEYLPNHSAGAYDDKRLNLVIDDGMNFVASTEQKFDVIMSDSTDPIGPGEVLFTSKFYENCKRILNPGGVLVTQNGVVFMQMDEVEGTHRRLSNTFKDAWFYGAAVPTYIGGIMTLAWGTDDTRLRQLPLDVLKERFTKANFKTRYYNPAIHHAAFALPQYVLDKLHTIDG